MPRRPILAPLFALLALTTLAQEAEAGARRSRPLQTGQTTCWDSAGTVIDCMISSGQDGELRRGEPRAYQDNGDGTIRDKRAALTWEKLSDDGSVHDKDTGYTWAQAFGKIDFLNTEPCFAGFCDWRLPNRLELLTLLDLGAVLPAVPAAFNNNCGPLSGGNPGCTVLTCSCTLSDDYWSSSTNIDNPSSAWSVDFAVGRAADDVKADALRVRAVRGGS